MTNNLSSTALAWLLTYAVHSTVLIGCAWLATRTRRLSPAAADVLWKSALLGGLITASIQLRLDLRPAGSIALVRPAVTASAAAPVANSKTTTVEDVVAKHASESPSKGADPSTSLGMTSSSPETISPSPESSRPALASIVVIAWAMIGLLLAISFAARRLILTGRLGDRRVVDSDDIVGSLEALSRDAGLSSPPRLTATTRISSPIALGLSEICVPETALSELDAEQQRSMLAHELAHLARRDPVWLAVASIIERVLWIQPLNRVARRQMATAAEFLCDDWAVRRTGSSVALARCLAQVAEWIQASPLGVPVAGMAEERSLLVTRVARLLEQKLPSARSKRVVAFAVVAVLIATIVVAPGVSGRAVNGGEVALAQQVDTRPPSGNDSSHEPQSAAVPPLPATGSRTVGNAPLANADTAVVIALIARLQDEDADVREAAANSLGKLEDARAVPGLIGALRDSSPKVRAAAAEALGQFQDPRATAPLVVLLTDRSDDVKQHALDALSNYEAGVPTASVVRLLTDSNSDIRHKAAHLLGQMKDRSASEALGRAVRDSSPDVRQAAIQALAELHDVSSASAILPALTDANSDVRDQALSALSDLRAPIPENALLALMRDPKSDIRARAAEVAGERSIVATIPTLRRLLDDTNGDVREHAIQALGNIADPAAHEALKAALSAKDAKVRRAAAEALGERKQ